MASGAGSLNNRVTVHRPSQVVDEYRDVKTGFVAAGGPHWMSIERDGGGLRDYGPGTEATGAAKAECYAAVDVRANDVLRVIAGPSAGTLWKVVASFDAGRGKRDLRLDAYTGTPP